MTQNRLEYISENIFKLREHERWIGNYLYDEFDNVLARIQALLAEPETYRSRYLVVMLGGMLSIEGKTILLPVEVCKPVDMGKVKTAWRKESLMDAPSPLDPRKVSQEEEERILDYFDLEPHWTAEPSPEIKQKNEDLPAQGSGNPNRNLIF
ncbi:MAG: helix-turn-helix domain-containing protein [Nitrospinaceae bacterium]